ncbi:MAG: orotidine-5'-phosphate decarboxylase [Gammaproteobacteria bacterium]
MKLDEPRIIVALDYAEQQEALALVEQLDPQLCRLKIGKEMFTRFGPPLVTRLVKQGFAVFLDLKFHDIPNTVANACLAAADLGVWMINVHAQGGRKMLEAARAAIEKRQHQRPLLVGVTLLTSLDEHDIREIGWLGDTNAIVLRLAHLCEQAGLDGVVCSAREVALLRSACGEAFCLITPGIRLEQTPGDDQKRTMTPREALSAGANYLVIGRPITRAQNPLQVLKQIQQQIG